MYQQLLTSFDCCPRLNPNETKIATRKYAEHFEGGREGEREREKKA